MVIQFVWALVLLSPVVAALVWNVRRWAGARRKIEPPVVVAEIDTASKARRREEQHRGWERDFLDALGDEAEALVREWGEKSPRLQLARMLKRDQEEAEKRGDWTGVEVAHRMRTELCAHPYDAFPLERIKELMVERVEWFVIRKAKSRAAAG